ncbi:MAG: ribosome recycling factor [Magnetococcales bacterium]|nr:ribosome recycling factor [Magnetococcales bacterium]
MSNDPAIKDAQTRMKKAIAALKEELAGVRAGRASTALLEHVVVEAYGSPMPLNQVASLSAPESRLITVQPWDKGTVAAIEKAIRDAGLGLNPVKDGGLIRVPLPELTEARRKEMVKLIHKQGEHAKVAVRNIRRDAIDHLRRQEKSKAISQDDLHTHEKSVQDLTDRFIAEIDQAIAQKEKDVLEV